MMRSSSAFAETWFPSEQAAETPSCGLEGFAIGDEAELERGWRRALQRLTDLLLLENDWDDDGAVPPEPLLVSSAAELLHRLQSISFIPPDRVVPTPDGHVLLEWQSDGSYLEAEVAEPHYAEWMRRTPDGRYFHWTESWSVFLSNPEKAQRVVWAEGTSEQAVASTSASTFAPAA